MTDKHKRRIIITHRRPTHVVPSLSWQGRNAELIVNWEFSVIQFSDHYRVVIDVSSKLNIVGCVSWGIVVWRRQRLLSPCFGHKRVPMMTRRVWVSTPDRHSCCNTRFSRYQQLIAWKKHFLSPPRLWSRAWVCVWLAPRSRASCVTCSRASCVTCSRASCLTRSSFQGVLNDDIN